MSPEAGGGTDEPKRPRKPRGAKRRGLGGLRRGEAVYLVAAIALFVFMFFDWFGVKGDGAGLLVQVAPFGGGNAWQTLDVIPLFLMLAIAVAVGAGLLRLTRSDWKPAIPASAAVAVLGGLATVLILVRILSPPGPNSSAEGITIEPTLKVGVFLALAAALGIAYGGYRALRQEGDSFQGIAKRLESNRPKPKARPQDDIDAKPKRRFAKSPSKKRSQSSSD